MRLHPRLVSGDALFKINDGTTVTIGEADINWAQQQLGINGNTPTGSNNAQNLGSGAPSGHNPGSSSGPTQPSTPDVPEEIKANPHAYANYMALQEQAKAEGNPDKYKGYNVLGGEKISVNNTQTLNGNWVKKTVNGIEEYSYDPSVKSQNDLNTYHQIKRQGEVISWTESKGTVLPDGYNLDGYTFYSDGSLIDPNGKKVDQIMPIQTEKYDIFVSRSPNAVDPKTLHKNLMGTSYTGPNNPKTYSGVETYDYIPRNVSEFASITHDKAYSKKNASGVSGALFNTDVISDDLQLVGSNLNNCYKNPNFVDKTRSALTAFAFSELAFIKSIVSSGKLEN